MRKRPLNKKELGKNEEDIIDTHSNSITVHETKLKVGFFWHALSFVKRLQNRELNTTALHLSSFFKWYYFCNFNVM